MKIESVNVKIECMNVRTAQEYEKTHLGHDNATQPLGFPSKHSHWVYRPCHRHGHIKTIPTNVSQTAKVEMTHRMRAHAAQPRRNLSRRACGVVGPRRRRRRIKSAPTNVSRTRISGSAYLGCVNAIWPNRRPKKLKGKLDELTFKCRMQGESRRDVEDYG